MHTYTHRIMHMHIHTQHASRIKRFTLRCNALNMRSCTTTHNTLRSSITRVFARQTHEKTTCAQRCVMHRRCIKNIDVIPTQNNMLHCCIVEIAYTHVAWRETIKNCVFQHESCVSHVCVFDNDCVSNHAKCIDTTSCIKHDERTTQQRERNETMCEFRICNITNRRSNVSIFDNSILIDHTSWLSLCVSRSNMRDSKSFFHCWTWNALQ